MLFVFFWVDDLKACRYPLEGLFVFFGVLHEPLVLLYYPFKPVTPWFLSISEGATLARYRDVISLLDVALILNDILLVESLGCHYSVPHVCLFH